MRKDALYRFPVLSLEVGVRQSSGHRRPFFAAMSVELMKVGRKHSIAFMDQFRTDENSLLFDFSSSSDESGTP